MFQLLLLVDAFGMLCYAIVAVASLFDPAHDSIEVAFYFLIGLALVGGGVYAGFVLRRGGRQGWWPLALVLPLALIGVIFGLPVLVGQY